jgi:copper homeostasis protein
MVVEAIACSADDARIAEQAGAHRAEVCSAIALGGLTASIGTFKAIRNATSLPLMAMIRPRIGGFCYSDLEFQAMVEDVATLIDAGADGVVIGALTIQSDLDLEKTGRLIDAARGKQITYHRAIDATNDVYQSLEQLINLGVTRVLTSGGFDRAVEGVETLKSFVETVAGRTEILLCGGVRSENVRRLVDGTGAREVHLGPFKQVEDRSTARSDHSSRLYGGTYPVLDGEEISKVVAALR